MSYISHVEEFNKCIGSDGKIIGQLMEHMIRSCLKTLLEPEGITVRNEIETRHYFEAMRNVCVDGKMEASLWKSDISFFFRVFQVYIQIKWSESPEVAELEEFIKHVNACNILITACQPRLSRLHYKTMALWICKTTNPRIIELATSNNITIITGSGSKNPVIFAANVIRQLVDLFLISPEDDRSRACEYIIHEFSNRIKND
jgi:hypothetical protein